jgi:hypothetical protein
MYTNNTGLIVGFHGCDEELRDKILNKDEKTLKYSKNTYDWLGSGSYFWENDHERAMKFAIESAKRKGSKIKKPAVIGAVLNLGHCLDLLNATNIGLVAESYKSLVKTFKTTGEKLPINTNPDGIKTPFHLLRHLDCAVIQLLHLDQDKIHPFDSVRGLFPEGDLLYENAGFREKNHIQICVRNPNCIKGFFLPRETNDDWATL